MNEIVIISASQRADSNSARVTVLVEDQLRAKGHTARTVDLRALALPFWGMGEGEHSFASAEPILAAADGFVIVSPEWCGMATPILKNFFLYAKNAHLGHKPALIVSVSTGMSGTYAAVDVKTFGAKNNHLVFIPEQLIIRQVETFLDDYIKEEMPHTIRMKRRISYSLEVLAAYAVAVKPLRQSGLFRFDEFGDGL